MDHAARFNRFLDKRDQAGGRNVRVLPACGSVRCLCRLLERRRRSRPYPCSDGPACLPLDRRGRGLIDFNGTRQLVSSRSDHGAPQLVQPSPGGLITAQTQDPLETQCASAALLVGNEPHGLKPTPHRFPRALEVCSGDQRGLPLARAASQQAAPRHPGVASATSRATKAIRPPHPLKICDARPLRREPLLELLNRPRVIDSADGVRTVLAHHYILGLRERNG